MAIPISIADRAPVPQSVTRIQFSREAIVFTWEAGIVAVSDVYTIALVDAYLSTALFTGTLTCEEENKLTWVPPPSWVRQPGYFLLHLTPQQTLEEASPLYPLAVFIQESFTSERYLKTGDFYWLGGQLIEV